MTRLASVPAARLLQSAEAALRAGSSGGALAPQNGAPETARPVSAGRLVLLVFVFGPLYGAAMGSYSTLEDGRALPVLFSAIKVPLLLLLTFAISVPSFFVLNTLLGARDDFADALRALASTQACLTVVLAALAPFTLFFYASGTSYGRAILFNAAMFALASASAQIVLRRLYAPLIRRRPVHRALLRLWPCVFAFVGVQMGWMLRPFIGDPGAPTRLFRPGLGGNAYLEVARMAGRALTPSPRR